jgi:hypothetical protein
MPANYLIRLTEGDYTATYTIYYGSVDSSNIATLLGSNLPAEGLTLDEMLTSVSIAVPGTADSIIVVGEGYCANSIEFQITPTEQPPPPPPLCMTFITDGVLNSWQFQPVSSQNDKTKWEFTIDNKVYTIAWNPFVVPNRWDMKFVDNVIFVTTNNSEIPDSGWTIEGFTTQYDDIIGLKVIQGQCPTVEPLITEVQADTNLCRNLTRCTGVLTVLNTVGGTPPYTYSLDDSTPTTSVIIDDICPGNHVLTTIDSIGVETTNNFTIGTGQEPITYSLDIDFENVTNVNTSTTNTETTTWTITPIPALTAGARLTFDLILETKQTLSLPGVGFMQDFNSVFLNNVELTNFTTSTTTTTVPRTDGCSNFNKTTVSEKRKYTITLTENDTLSGTGESILYIPIGYGQNVNNCITKLEQDVILSVSNFTTLSPCSTTEVPPTTNILSNSLIPGYNLINRLCDATYCQTNCCLYFAEAQSGSQSDFVFVSCSGVYTTQTLIGSSYFCHDNSIYPIIVQSNVNLSIIGCCPDIPEPTVNFEYNLCGPNLDFDIFYGIGNSPSVYHYISNSQPSFCSVIEQNRNPAGSRVIINIRVTNQTKGFYIELYDGPILIEYVSLLSGQGWDYDFNTSVGRDYRVKIYDLP